MSSSKKKEIIAISSDSSESSDFDARPWPWEDYFPKEFKASDYFEPAKTGEPISNLTTKEEQKMAFKARVQILGIPCKKKLEEFGVKPFEKKGPKDQKGKGKNKMG
ncbi:hypothetical protein CTI12_AA203660 [Artemisia annua]|uniref:Uncharacterized protein n=1 Tax=Artemisia annua TaxID=35608 RepID=A0A2U1P1H6_ARTAN|nr:hypothetical protein CTI12_AA203660 [Artemisia annua]